MHWACHLRSRYYQHRPFGMIKTCISHLTRPLDASGHSGPAAAWLRDGISIMRWKRHALSVNKKLKSWAALQVSWYVTTVASEMSTGVSGPGYLQNRMRTRKPNQ